MSRAFGMRATAIAVAVTVAAAGLVFAPPTAAVADDAPPSIVLGTPVVVGTAAVGQQLRADHADWSMSAVSVEFAYQWRADGVPIPGEVDQMLTVTRAMAGKRISYTLTATAGGFATTTVGSLATPRVTTPMPATVRGIEWPGNTMSMSPGSWPAGTTLRYQWLMGVGVPIAGAVGTSLRVPQDGGGTSIGVLVTASRPGYETVAVGSQRYPSGLMAVAPLRVVSAVSSELPADEERGMLTGLVWGVDATAESLVDARVRVYSLGTGLTAASPRLVAEVQSDAVGRFSVPDLPPGSYCTAVTSPDARFASIDNCKGDLVWVGDRVFAGAVTDGSVGLRPPGTLQGVVSASNDAKVAGGTVNVYRQYTVASGATGFYRVATTRTDGAGRYAVAGLESGAVYLEFSGPTSLSHQTVWWDPTPGMRSAPPTARSAGAAILESKKVTTAHITLPAYLPIHVPRVKGTVRVGGTLTASFPRTSGATYTYQWYAGGRAVKGATKKTFTVARGQAGKPIAVKLVGTRKGYATTTRSSAATARALLATAPRVLGTTRSGHVLTAAHGQWTSGTTFAYQWYRNGKPIAAATKKTYRLRASDRLDRISVKVTGKKKGYATVARISAKTPRIRG